MKIFCKAISNDFVRELWQMKSNKGCKSKKDLESVYMYVKEAQYYTKKTCTSWAYYALFDSSPTRLWRARVRNIKPSNWSESSDEEILVGVNTVSARTVLPRPYQHEYVRGMTLFPIMRRHLTRESSVSSGQLGGSDQTSRTEERVGWVLA